MVVRVIPVNDARPFDMAGFARDIKALMVSTTADGQRFIAKYPPQTLRKTNYRRTGTLKRSWSSKVRTSKNKITGTIGSNSNIAPYNRWVQGKPQSKLFRTSTWRNIDDLLKVVENDFIKGSEDIATRHARI